MGPDTAGFASHRSHMKQEEAVHGGRTVHFKVPAKHAPKAKAKPKVWDCLGALPVAPPQAPASGFDYSRLESVQQPF